MRLPEIQIQFLIAASDILVDREWMRAIGSRQPAENFRASLLYQMPYR